jgi:hypothetical protein
MEAEVHVEQLLTQGLHKLELLYIPRGHALMQVLLK